jgi:HAMP domain-containing protein
VFIPIAAIVAWGAVRIATIQAEHKKGADPGTSDRLNALENEVGTLRQELSEAHERLDFTERLLAQQRPTERLDEGK